MPRSLPHFFAVLTAVLSLSVRPVSAAAVEEQAASEPLITLDFAGGTLTAFADAVARAHGQPVNLILPDKSPSLTIPPVKVSQVPLSELLTAVSLASVNRIAFEQVARRGDGAVRIEGARPTWVVRTAAFSQDTTIRVFPIERLLEKYSVNDITTAMRTTWEMSGDGAAELKFHPETRLLIVRGTHQQANYANEVFRALSSVLPQPPEATDEVVARQARRAEIERQKAQLELELTGMKERYLPQHPLLKSTQARLNALNEMLKNQ